MRFAAGIDVGSTQTKAILLGERCEILARVIVPTGANVVAAAERAYDAALAEGRCGREAVGCVAGTGYGRFKVRFGNIQVTEITCHARGAHFLFPGTRTVVDMGGQDTKAIRVGSDGEVLDFAMNDKCAAGTGRFLAAAAEVMGLSLDEIGPLSLTGKNPVRLTSVCTVFVESDIMSYLAQRKAVPDILAGVHRSISARTVSLVRRVGLAEEVAFTGGVSRNAGMVMALEAVLGTRMNVSPDAHYMGALGAALFARDRVLAGAPSLAAAELGGWSDGVEESAG